MMWDLWTSAAVYLNSAVFWDVSSVGWFRTDVWGSPIDPTFTGQAVQEEGRKEYSLILEDDTDT
jgi:hypothetical protein